MRKRIGFLIYQGIFWVALFVLLRCLFLVYYYNQTIDIGFFQAFKSIFTGIKLDISVMGYLLVFPSLLLLFSSLLSNKAIKIIYSAYFYLILFVIILISIVDLELYKHWGFRLDNTPLLYLETPKEAMASANLYTVIEFIVLLFVLYFIVYKAYNKWIIPVIIKFPKVKLWQLPLFILFLGLLIIPVRGGFSIAPINIGTVYFSNKTFANHAAINVQWNVFYSLSQKNNIQKVHYFNDDEASEIFKKSNWYDNESLDILKSKKPNIVIIVWESLTAKIVAPLGGMERIVPHFENYISEGIFFNNCYASGDRSDKGIISILSGYPAQPTTSIIKFANKTQNLPFLAMDLKNVGYNTSFYYGGDIDFANMRSYFLNSKFDNIIDLECFDDSLNTSKWGVHDEFVFSRLLKDIKQTDKPFLKVYFTLSSHEPFDVPMKTVIEPVNDEAKFLNSMVYTDKCLHNFLDDLKKTQEWNNTLVIVVADHGARHPGNSPNYPPEKFHIPLLWLGGALQVKDTVINNYVSQTDIPISILNQLNIESDKYIFSKNIFSKNYSSTAFYAFNNGFGYISDSSVLVYDIMKNDFIISKGNTNDFQKDSGKAYLQILLNDF